jgi:predicted membrane protein
LAGLFSTVHENFPHALDIFVQEYLILELVDLTVDMLTPAIQDEVQRTRLKFCFSQMLVFYYFVSINTEFQILELICAQDQIINKYPKTFRQSLIRLRDEAVNFSKHQAAVKPKCKHTQIVSTMSRRHWVNLCINMAFVSLSSCFQ